MEEVIVTFRTIAVEHVRIASAKPFAQVRDDLEALLPKLDPTVPDALRRDDVDAVRAFDERGKLSIFLERDHGALLASAGGARNALQYEIGNPLTASRMTRHQLPAALYAPLRVVLYADESGRGVFEYDQPSSLFGQFGDDRVMAVGRMLDAELEEALRQAAG